MSSPAQALHTLEVVRDIEVAAPIDIVFETILEQLGPLNQRPDGTSLQMKLEAWPGGRLYRDLGSNAGHLWGHVQSIRPNDLIEIHGPFFMSGPVVGHLLYRLKEENGATRIQFSHRTYGLIPPEFADGKGINEGWGFHFEQIRKAAEQKQPKAVKGGKK